MQGHIVYQCVSKSSVKPIMTSNLYRKQFPKMLICNLRNESSKTHLLIHTGSKYDAAAPGFSKPGLEGENMALMHDHLLVEMIDTSHWMD